MSLYDKIKFTIISWYLIPFFKLKTPVPFFIQAYEKYAHKNIIKKKAILIASFPKSGSTHLSSTLQKITGFQKKYLISPGENHQQLDLYSPQILNSINTNFVCNQHFRAIDNNIALLEKFDLSCVVLVRNIFDSIVSMKDHMLKEGFVWPSSTFNSSFLSLSEEEKINAIIDIIGPWYVDFYASWKRFISINPEKILLIRYEDYIPNQEKIIRQILDFFNIKNPKQLPEEVINSYRSKIEANQNVNRFNIGVVGRGENLSFEQKGRIKKFTTYYPDVDFSFIGISKADPCNE